MLDRERTITRNLVALGPALAAASFREAISEIEQEWFELERSLLVAQTELRQRTNIIQQQLERLDITLDIWKLTVKEAQDARAPVEVMKLAGTTADDVAKTYKSLRQMLNRALALQANAGRARGSAKESLDRIKSEEANVPNNLSRRERPPFCLD